MKQLGSFIRATFYGISAIMVLAFTGLSFPTFLIWWGGTIAEQIVKAEIGGINGFVVNIAYNHHASLRDAAGNRSYALVGIQGCQRDLWRCEVKQFFAPLGVFVMGMVFLLGITLFMPQLDTSVAALSANTSGIAHFFWGWSWLMSSGVVRLLVFVIGFMCVCFFTGVAFLKSRTRL